MHGPVALLRRRRCRCARAAVDEQDRAVEAARDGAARQEALRHPSAHERPWCVVQEETVSGRGFAVGHNDGKVVHSCEGSFFVWGRAKGGRDGRVAIDAAYPDAEICAGYPCGTDCCDPRDFEVCCEAAGFEPYCAGMCI